MFACDVSFNSGSFHVLSKGGSQRLVVNLRSLPRSSVPSRQVQLSKLFKSGLLLSQRRSCVTRSTEQEGEDWFYSSSRKSEEVLLRGGLGK